uniref:Transposase n=1 Tax=Steinernema glaseri TaxID=37863 RepID=A0A1I7ZM83_9BILA
MKIVAWILTDSSHNRSLDSSYHPLRYPKLETDSPSAIAKYLSPFILGKTNVVVDQRPSFPRRVPARTRRHHRGPLFMGPL